jgi:hypothetical protein
MTRRRRSALACLARCSAIGSGILAPSEHRHAGQFRSIVADNRLGLAAPCHDGCQFPRDTQARERGVCNQGETLPAEVVDDCQNPEPAAIGEGVRHKVQAPALIGSLGTTMGLRVPSARLRPPRLRTCSFSSR